MFFILVCRWQEEKQGMSWQKRKEKKLSLGKALFYRRGLRRTDWFFCSVCLFCFSCAQVLSGMDGYDIGVCLDWGWLCGWIRTPILLSCIEKSGCGLLWMDNEMNKLLF